MNTADSRFRQKTSCCIRSSWPKSARELTRAPRRRRLPAGGAGRRRLTPLEERAWALLPPRVASYAVSVDEVEVDVLERRPPHLEALELSSFRDRAPGQLGERLRRLGGREDDLAAVLAVVDLDLGRRRDELARRADLHEFPLADHCDAVG